MALIGREEIKRYIMLQLGYPVVDVELDDSSIGEAISTAIDEYLSTGSVERGYWMTNAGMNTANNTIELPKDVATVCGVVYSKPFELMAGMAGSTDLFSYAMSGGGIFSAGTSSGYANFVHGSANLAMFYEYVQNRNRLMALEITWRVIDNKLFMYPYPTNGDKIIIEYSKNAFGVLSPDGAISTSNSWGTYWIKRMALATCKGMLANMRGKYSTMVGATGESVTLNSAELLTQWKEETAALREELANRHSHRQFYIA